MNHVPLFQVESRFFIGCNYWASHAGTAMWSDWRPDRIDADLGRLAAAGIEIVRIFPLWPDFQPIHSLFSGKGRHAGYRFGEQRLTDDEAGRAGVSVVMMERFEQFCAIAARHGIRIVVALVTGWMSGRLFVPPALIGKPILTDPDAIRWQVRFVTCFVRRMRGIDAIVAWDLGNECNEMGEVQDRAQAFVWTAAVANAIRGADGTRPIVSGMHSLTATGNWTIQDQGELTDVLTTHPYPFWTPFADHDPIDSMRATLHATAESLLYADLSGKPCFAEEIGTMGPMVCSDEVAAAFARTSAWSQWAHGLPGLMWWCSSDQRQLTHPPYDWTACEGELGLMTEDGTIKPVLRALAGVKDRIAGLPIAELPPHRIEGVCILNSVQDHWATAFGAFLLSKQAGIDIRFRFEDQELPDSELYLLPCITGVAGVPKPLWSELLRRVAKGATLYLSCNDGYMLDFAAVTGLKVRNRRRRHEAAEICGGDDNGEDGAKAFRLPLLGEFRLDYEPVRAEVLFREPDGNPAVTRAAYGKGAVIYCSLPLESTFTSRTGLPEDPDVRPYWLLYSEIFAEFIRQRVLVASNPYVALTEHVAGDVCHVIAVNHSATDRDTLFAVRDGWRMTGIPIGVALDETPAHVRCIVPANDAVVIRLSAEPR